MHLSSTFPFGKEERPRLLTSFTAATLFSNQSYVQVFKYILHATRKIIRPMLHLHSAQGTCVFRYLLGNMNWQHFENLNTISEFIVVLKIYVFVQRCQT